MQEKILIVDDSRVNRMVLARMLTSQGFAVVESSDGAGAIHAALAHRPDLILLDVMMPGIDGFEVCARMKRDPALRSIPVIFLSGLGEVADKVRGLDLGAVDYITRPFEASEVLARTRTHLALQRISRELLEANGVLQAKQEQLTRDLDAAGDIQRSLICASMPAVDALITAWRLLPCEQVGGDGFGVTRLPGENVGIYIFDVSGHGVPAAMIAVSVSLSFSPDSGQVLDANAADGPEALSPAAVLSRLDCDYPIERFGKHVTLGYLVLDRHSGNLRYSLAGHPPVLLQRAAGGYCWLDSGGSVIGLGGMVPFEEGSDHLAPGDRLFLYTDGIPELADRHGEFFGLTRFVDVLERSRGCEIEAVCDAVVAELRAFGGDGPPQDDVAILGVEYRGGASSTAVKQTLGIWQRLAARPAMEDSCN